VSCTQEELLQVMQKLISERQKVKALERRLQRGPAIETIAAPAPTPQEKEIELLKNIVGELREKVKEIPPPASSVPAPASSPDESAIKQSLVSTQKELRNSKERCIELEEAIRRSSQFRTTLQAELKEQQAKAHEGEHLRRELEQQKVKVAELELFKKERLTSQQGDIVTKNLYLEEHEKRERSESALSEQKQLLFQSKKQIEELEERLTRAEQEKEFSKKRLQETTSAIQDHEIQKLSLSEENKIHQKSIESLSQVYEDQKKRIDLLESEKKQATTELATATKTLAANDHRLQQLVTELEETEKHGELLAAQEKNLTEEKERLTQEIGELESHLARRVKECTELSTLSSQQAQTIADQAEKIQALSNEAASITEQYETLENMHASAEEELKTRTARLEEIEVIAEKYYELEKLFEEGAAIITKKASPQVRRKTETRPISPDFARALHYDSFQ